MPSVGPAGSEVFCLHFEDPVPVGPTTSAGTGGVLSPSYRDLCTGGRDRVSNIKVFIF